MIALLLQGRRTYVVFLMPIGASFVSERIVAPPKYCHHNTRESLPKGPVYSASGIELRLVSFGDWKLPQTTS